MSPYKQVIGTAIKLGFLKADGVAALETRMEGDEAQVVDEIVTWAWADRHATGGTKKHSQIVSAAEIFWQSICN